MQYVNLIFFPLHLHKTGLVLGVLALFGMAFLANIAMTYILEVCARGELLDNPDAFATDGGVEGVSEAGSVNLGGMSPALRRQIGSSQNLPLLLTVKKRKYEMPTLCSMFLGHWGRASYMLCLSIYIYGALLAYATVFSNAVAAMFPLPEGVDSYAIYLALFAALVIPLSCLELTEMVSIQMALAVCRVLMVACMVGTVLAAETTGHGKDSFPGQTGGIDQATRLWDPSGLPVLLPIAAYSFIYHHSIPGLSHPVKNKKLLGNIFRATFVICFLAYGSVGVIVGAFFGPSMPSSSNLAWRDYGGNAFSKIVGSYILLFPALDVASAFPLNAITLGNNILDMKDEESRAGPPSRAKIVAFRLVAAIPPLIVAFFLRDLGRISEFAGTVGIIITLVFPALLNLKSRTIMKDTFGLDSAKTYYTSELSRKRYGPVNLLIGVGLFLYIFINLLMEK